MFMDIKKWMLRTQLLAAPKSELTTGMELHTKSFKRRAHD